jgi:YHS domain-containing protein
MKRMFIAALVIVTAFTLSCGSKQEEQKPAQQQPTHSATKASLVDPVDGTPVDITNADYSWVYNDVEYYFHSEKNMKEFQKDPDKYLKSNR